MIPLRVIVLCIGMWLIVSIGNALAAGSGGFRVETPDAGAFGKGSAFVGEANTPAAVYYNPAGLNQIKNFEISVGGAYIGPQGSYKNTSGQETQMRRNSYLIPHVYATIPVNKKFVLGFGASSYWGLGTEWAADSFSRYVATKSEITNTDTMFTGSYRLTDRWFFAVSADNDESRANESKALNNAGFASDGNIQLKAKDNNAWGYRIATLFKINDKNQVGLMYRSAIHHRYVGKIYIDGLGPAYLASFASPYNFQSSSYETRATEKLILPQSVVMGYSFKPTKKWTINLDLEWMNWSRFKQEVINYPDETDPGRLAFLNASNPIDHHWHSAFSEAIGGEYAVNDRLRLRGGYYHHAHVVPQGTLSSSLPDSDSHGITTGLGYDFNKHLTLDIAYSGIIYKDRKVNNKVGSSVGANINGKYRQFTNIGMATVTYKF